MKTKDETLIKALHVLANDIQSEDGVATAAKVAKMKELIQAGDIALALDV